MRSAAVPPEQPESGRSLRSVEQGTTPGATPTQDRRDGDDSASTLGLDLLRSLADQEIARAETARSRSRQAFALAAGFFAVVQTVAYGSFVNTLVAEHHSTATLIAATKWASIALGLCGVALLAAELPFRTTNLTPEIISKTVKEPPPGKSTLDEFVELYGLIVGTHRRANQLRTRCVILTQGLALISIVLVIWELLVGLHISP